MKDQQISKYWKIITCIRTLFIGYQNAYITTATQCFVKVVKYDIDNTQPMKLCPAIRDSASILTVYMLEFIQSWPDIKIDNPSKEIWALVRKVSAGVFTTKLLLNEHLCYHSYKWHTEHILIAKAKENCLTKPKKLLYKLRYPQDLTPYLLWR